MPCFFPPSPFLCFAISYRWALVPSLFTPFFLNTFDLKWIFVKDGTCGKETQDGIECDEDKSFEFPWRVDVEREPFAGSQMGRPYEHVSYFMPSPQRDTAENARY